VFSFNPFSSAIQKRKQTKKMTTEEFEETIIKPSFVKPVLVDFWADWCDPCKLLEPILDGLASENNSAWQLEKIDIDQSPELKERFDIMGVPAIRIFSKGEVIGKFNGLMWKKEMGRWIEEALKLED
jgi:thioredoxin